LKVALAYSGGLDTSVAVKLLQERGADVITVLLDMGQPHEEVLDAEVRAEKLGVHKHYTVDAKAEFVRDYVFPAIKANLQHDGCFLTPALTRPLIALKTIEIAEKEGASVVAHGATKMGNDQFVYERVFKTRAPQLEVLAPIRDAGMTRKEEIVYAKRHGVPLPGGYKRPLYSVDVNIYGRAVSGGALKNFNVKPGEDIYTLTTSPEKAPDAEVVKIEFEGGCPTKLDGKKMDGVEIIKEISMIGGRHGIGRASVMHGRTTLKSLAIIEAPAPAVLIPAHMELERLVLTNDELRLKRGIEGKLSQLVHEGLWFDPLIEDLFAFVDKTQENVTGELSVELHKGEFYVMAKNSPYTLCKEVI